MSALCPRCRASLIVNQVDEFTVRVCVPCKGMLMPHADVMEILARSWRMIPKDEAEKQIFHAAKQVAAEPAIECPDCHKKMDKYGYMELAAIPIDRCDACSLLWLDAEELQKMVLALAKSNHRSELGRQREVRTQLTVGHTAKPDVVDAGVTVMKLLAHLR